MKRVSLVMAIVLVLSLTAVSFAATWVDGTYVDGLMRVLRVFSLQRSILKTANRCSYPS